jgi:hypothetical protein
MTASTTTCVALLLCALCVGGFRPRMHVTHTHKHTHTSTSKQKHKHTVDTHTNTNKHTLRMTAPFDCAAFPKVAHYLYGDPSIASSLNAPVPFPTADIPNAYDVACNVIVKYEVGV